MATYDLTQGIPSSSQIKEGDILNCPYSGTYKFISLPRGIYSIYCWGAQGGGSDTSGDSNSGIGGKGGFAYGKFVFTLYSSIYLYVGGKGGSAISGLASGGWNGGGSAFGSGGTEPANGGGGASDVRLATNYLQDRFIVAGGGGGGGEDSADSGGGAELAGTNGGNYPGTISGSSGGAAFGYGANTSYDGGAGGGGWYGGGTNGGSQSIPTTNNTSDAGGGSGGSNYVYASSTASYHPSSTWLSSDNYALKYKTYKGNEIFPSPSGDNETGHSGDGYIRIVVERIGKTYNLSSGIPSSSVLRTGDCINCSYSGNYKKITLPPGVYKLWCYGAAGGYRSSHEYAGGGGYSEGTLTLLENTDLYLYAGGSGNTGGSSGGWNGGGRRSSYPGGGGASDIRIGSTSLYARVIVAGGGGSDGAASKKGGDGGGTSGQSVGDSYGTGGYGGGPTGVTNSSWQTTSQSTSTTTQSGAYAGFGFGGNGISYASGHGGAGGGGWYGGSGSYPDGSGDDDRGGGGGSSYVYTSSTASQYPSGCLLNSSYYLTNTSLQQGGNSVANGNIYIYVLKIDVNGVYVKMNGTWTKATEVLSKVNNIWQEAL